MDLNAAFDRLQEAADADPDRVAEARRRRDLFDAAFSTEADVVEVIPSGSLARSTQREPINDVDVIIVFDPGEHGDWGEHGDSAGAALDHLQGRVKGLLGSGGSFAEEVWRAQARNHSVKCWLDDPTREGAFTVDAMPALRRAGGGLLVPEKKSSGWIATDPELLIGRVRARQEAWDLFRPLVRLLKFWNDCHGGEMKSLAVEVLALANLPAETNRPRALQRFFAAAVVAIDGPIEDPAGLCGEIQPDLDREAARRRLDEAASDAWKAVNAQEAGETERAGCLWRRVFGEDFPQPDGGCGEEEEAEDELGAFNIGGAAGAAAAIGVDRPRPVTDAPQG
jgi:hypothetical protein